MCNYMFIVETQVTPLVSNRSTWWFTDKSRVTCCCLLQGMASLGDKLFDGGSKEYEEIVWAMNYSLFGLRLGWQANWWDHSQDDLDDFHRWVKSELSHFLNSFRLEGRLDVARGSPVDDRCCRWLQPGSQSGRRAGACQMMMWAVLLTIVINE